MHDGTVLVVAKAPVPGRSKTRLVPPLHVDEAAALHLAMLLDTVDACHLECADVRLLCPSEDDALALAQHLPEVPCVVQQGRGLGAALGWGIAEHAGARPCALVSSDVPGLPPGELRAAFDALADGADVALGPALDGGYWLIAMNRHHPAPFHEIPWSTPAVMAVTRERCALAGLIVAEVGRWRDVDTLVDLAALAHELAQLPGQRTADVLRSLAETIPARVDVDLESSTLLADSPWRSVIRDTLRLGNRDTEYAYLGVPRAVFVAAVTDADELLLVRQYRHPVRDWTLEVPAGSVHDGESALEAAKRELREETGGTASSWSHLTTFFSSSAHLSLRSDAFLALGVELSASDLDEGEQLTLVRMPLREARTRARAGGFAEGQTALTILLAAERIEGSVQ